MRTYLVTGVADGIGRATAERLAKEGHRVIGVDRRDAEIVADLGTPDGRRHLVAEAGRIGGVDAVVAVAGTAEPDTTPIAVNYFGMVATLAGLRPLLAAAPAPRAVAVTSIAAIAPADEALVSACLAGDEPAALDRARTLVDEGRAVFTAGSQVYTASKVALARWVRRTAAGPEWAGAGIPLNAVGPGVVLTAMTRDILATPSERAILEQVSPSPLNGVAEPAVPAGLLAWLASPENTHVTGQVIYCDGGADATLRGDQAW
ncbi:SDR family oxidoreductase [Plantactinospora sp. WMMB334]|uniref:SDR family oxidoreductase n=1 Tax=Plantactinospora sp. WMMB334 TaxID=3404119 RepID=UPI003B93DC89